MNYKTKINAGIFIALYISNRMEHTEIIIAVILTASSIIGSLIPDIDQSALMKKKLKFKLLNKITKDNIKLHGPLLYCLLYSVIYAVVKDDVWKIIFNGIFIGLFSHLILDGISYSGIAWFYPISKKTTSIGNKKNKCKI